MIFTPSDRGQSHRGRILLICGSSRRGAINCATLRTAAALAPPDVETDYYCGIGELPMFSPDDDVEGAALDPRVDAMREQVRRATAALICTPEYAGALPAALKNLLEWTIGDAGLDRKPVAWINAAGPAAPTGAMDAHLSLRKVLTYAGAHIIEEACIRVPITRDLIGSSGLVDNDDARQRIAEAIKHLADHARDSPQ